MDLKKLTEKIAEYKARLEAGKARKIKSGHVEKVLKKLRRKETDLSERIAASTGTDKCARFKRKRAVARAQIERAEWLLEHLSADHSKVR